MALKPYTNHNGEADEQAQFVVNEVAEPGIILVHDPSGTGTGLPGDSRNVAKIPGAVSSTRPIGVLLTEVVDLDVTKYELRDRNHKRVTTKCNFVDILSRGEIETNMVSGSPTPGAAAHYSPGGLFTTATTSPRVGTFLGTKQSNGYVVVRVHIP